MRKLFQKKLLIFVVLAFFATFGISWYLQRQQAELSALELLSLNLVDAADRVKRTEANRKTVLEMTSAAAIAKTRAFAMLVQKTPGILRDPGTLETIRKKLDVDELHVSDKTGKLIASIAYTVNQGMPHYRGFNLASSDQSKVFTRAISDPDFELVQEPRHNGAENKLFQYAGVARMDEPGVVQIGYRVDRLQHARQLADVKAIEREMRIGMKGKLLISDNPGHPENYRKTERTSQGLSRSIVCGQYLLTAILPWEEVHNANSVAIKTLFTGNLIVFALVFFLIVRLLQKVVINELSSVTDSLNEMSRGNFNKTIEGNSSPELRALAQSLNNTLYALKKNVANSTKQEKAELEIAKMLQSSTLPADLPEATSCRIAAELFASRDASGNFYDFFEVDKDHVAILLADASGKGIPAVLYMMMAKNILREAILKNPPDKALSIVNEKLCNAGQDMPLKIFLGVLNCHSGVLLCVNASHTDPLVKSRAGNVKFIKGPHHPFPGSSPETIYTSLPLQLNAGDRLFLYSAAALETKNEQGEPYGESRLRDLFSTPGSNEEMIKRTYKDLTLFAGTRILPNDTALVILEYRPEEEK